VKKYFVVVLAVLAVFALVACSGGSGGSGAESADAGVTGDWKLTKAEVGGVEVGGDQLGAYQYTFSLKDGGKASISVMGQSYETDYTFENDEVSFADQALSAMKLKKEGSQLVYDDATSGAKLYFEK
jgi:hypothetical protein